MPLKPRTARLLVLLATVVGVASTSRLMLWQLDRAHQKVTLQSALDARSVQPPIDLADLARTAEAASAQHYRRVHLRGQWVPGHTVFLENRQMNARVGFEVLTPLRLDSQADAVLVQRGWVPRDQLDRTRLPLVPTPSGVVEVEGRIAPPPARLYEFGASAPGVIRQNLDLGAFSRETGLALRPLSVQQLDAAASASDGLLRQWSQPAVDVQKHYGYAFQWGALGALMTGLYVWFQLIRPRLRHAP
jgi:surfeit locus 1 family protein